MLLLGHKVDTDKVVVKRAKSNHHTAPTQATFCASWQLEQLRENSLNQLKVTASRAIASSHLEAS